jgi:CDP-glycerol glycerophosphotransferase (TagB/SpsB family)
MRLIYKPHPFEKTDKLCFYQSQLSGMVVISVSDPIETIFYSYPNIKAVFAYGSSGLLYTDIFTIQQPLTIALFKLAALKQDEVLTNLLHEAGVEVPQTNAELVTLLQGLR